MYGYSFISSSRLEQHQTAIVHEHPGSATFPSICYDSPSTWLTLVQPSELHQIEEIMREKTEATPRDRELLIFMLYTLEQLEILRASMIFNFILRRITWKHEKFYLLWSADCLSNVFQCPTCNYSAYLTFHYNYFLTWSLTSWPMSYTCTLSVLSTRNHTYYTHNEGLNSTTTITPKLSTPNV